MPGTLDAHGSNRGIKPEKSRSKVKYPALFGGNGRLRRLLLSKQVRSKAFILKLIAAYSIAFLLPVILLVTGFFIYVPKMNRRITQIEVRETGELIGRLLRSTVLLENKKNLRDLGESTKSGIETLIVRADEQGWSSDEVLRRTLRYLDMRQAGEDDRLSLINMNGVIVHHPLENRIGEVFSQNGRFPSIRNKGSAFIPGDDAGRMETSYLVYIDALKLHLAAQDNIDGMIHEIPPGRFSDILNSFLSESVQVIVIRDSGGAVISGSSGYVRFSRELTRAASLEYGPNGDAAFLSRDRLYFCGTITGFDAEFEVIFDASIHREMLQLNNRLLYAAVFLGVIAIVLTSVITARIILQPIRRTDVFFRRRLQRAGLGTDTPVSVDILGQLALQKLRVIHYFERERSRRQNLERELSIKENKLVNLTNHDALTELPNRAFLGTALELAVKDCERHHRQLAVIFLDIDNFKDINDSLGHSAGDHLLRTTAQRITELLRAEDVMARFGGDEFVVLLQDIEGRGQAASVARRIIRSVNDPIVVEEQSTRPTVSIGIALYPDDGDTTEEIFRNADAAMHAVKRKEKNGFCFHHNSMNLDAQRRLAMKEQVSAALEHDEMRVMYQTIYSVNEKRIAGVEALVRWKNGTITVPPDNFLPYIENSEAITRLDLWITEAALREINGRPGLPDDLFININAAPIDLVSRDFYRRFLDAVERGGGTPDQVHLEITESTTIRDFQRVADTLQELKAAGVQIYLDDFGEGYSSIRYLRELGVNAVKLDRAYISNVGHSCEARSLVSGFVQMAHGINVSAVVEGVETKEQLDFLSRCGADYAQGYYFCKPVEIDGLCESTQLPGVDPYLRRRD